MNTNVMQLNDGGEHIFYDKVLSCDMDQVVIRAYNNHTDSTFKLYQINRTAIVSPNDLASPKK